MQHFLIGMRLALLKQACLHHERVVCMSVTGTVGYGKIMIVMDSYQDKHIWRQPSERQGLEAKE